MTLLVDALLTALLGLLLALFLWLVVEPFVADRLPRPPRSTYERRVLLLLVCLAAALLVFFAAFLEIWAEGSPNLLLCGHFCLFLGFLIYRTLQGLRQRRTLESEQEE